MSIQLVPGESLVQRMDTSTMDMLGSHCMDLAQDLEYQNEAFIRAIRVYWDWYDAKPRVKEKNTPFRKASNVVVPVIGMMTDAMVSQSLSTFTAAGDRFWQARVENEGNETVALNMARYVNWQARNDFNWVATLAGWLPEVYLLGSGVLALSYRREMKPLFYGPGATRRERLQYKLIEMLRGPNIENVPRENMLWDTSFQVHEAPVVVRIRQWTYSEMQALAQLDASWSKPQLEAVRGFQGQETWSTWDSVRASKAKRDDRADPQQDYRQPHVVYEMHVDWPMLGGRFEIPGDESDRAVQLPLLIHLHRKTGKILRCTAEPYHLPGKPFLDGFFRKHTGSGHSSGTGKKLEQIQSIQTTLFNQSIDAQTRANAIWAITTDPKFLTEPLDPAKPIKVNDMGQFAALNVGTSVQPNMALLQAAQIMAERWMGPSDPLMGRETRSGGHPAPATSTLALLEQATKMSAQTDLLLQDTVSRAGQWLAILDQQFETNEDGKLARVLGQSDAMAVTQFLFPTDPIPGNYFFEVTALSRTDNPDLQMRRALTIAQANNNYWSFVIQGATLMDSPQVGPRVKALYVRAIESMTKLYSRFLDAGNVDDMERFLAELANVGVDTQNAFQQFAAEQQQAAAAAAQQPGQPGLQRPGVAASGPGTIPSAGPARPAIPGPGNGAF